MIIHPQVDLPLIILATEIVSNYCDSTCELYGFNQYFDANLVEGFSFKSCKDSAAKKDLQRTSMPYGKRTLLNIGTLARSEKIAQPHFLKTVASLLEADHRFVFHYTGNIDREVVVQFAVKSSSRLVWLEPENTYPLTFSWILFLLVPVIACLRRLFRFALSNNEFTI